MYFEIMQKHKCLFRFMVLKEIDFHIALENFLCYINSSALQGGDVRNCKFLLSLGYINAPFFFFFIQRYDEGQLSS